MVSYLPCTQRENACGSKWQKTAVHTGFGKLFTAAVHVDTVKKILYNIGTQSTL